jgi:hypothetical protein
LSRDVIAVLQFLPADKENQSLDYDLSAAVAAMAEKLFAPISLGDAALSKAQTAPVAKWRLCS